MYDFNSRYYGLETAFWTAPDGTVVPYTRRRMLPQPESLLPIAEWPVAQSDRFDLIAARAIGDSQAYWRIADANRVMDPNELTETPGRRLVIPMPQPTEEP